MLNCELFCGFDFEEFYGEIARKFTECHHKVPVSELRKEVQVKISDLAIVRLNCHRMLHGTRLWLSVVELKTLIDHRS
jgi:predicted HNH restriction endonuclease